MTTYSADDLLTEQTDDPGTPTSDDVFATAAPQPEPVVVEEAKPEPVEGEVVRRDEVALPGEWAHEKLEFKGDVLEVRAPTDQALTAFSLASGRYVPMEIKNDIVGLFVAKHLSSDSYGKVFSRLMDPDDTDYNPETIGELMRAIVGISIEQRKAAEKAAAATPPA
ncbi:tail assembly chaperone [Gordonia phage Sisko]|nr:tail assembly chaperone [Gordonia phage Sisko]